MCIVDYLFFEYNRGPFEHELWVSPPRSNPERMPLITCSRCVLYDADQLKLSELSESGAYEESYRILSTDSASNEDVPPGLAPHYETFLQ